MQVRPRHPAVLPMFVVLLCGAARAEDGDTEADAAVRVALAKEFGFDFNETPLAEALGEVARKAGVEIVLEPSALNTAGRAPISWRSEKSSAERALRWVTRLTELEFRITDGAVLVAEPEKLAGKVVPRVYDVRDLSRERCGSPGPRVDFSPRDTVEEDARPSPESVAEMISTRVCPSTWDTSLGASIEEREGVLVVFQTPEVHAEIEALLASLRAARPRAVTVEVVVLAADAAKPSDGRFGESALTPEELERLIARAGEGAVIARATLTTLDGRAAHTIWGAKTHYVESKSLQWPEVKDERFYNERMEYEVVPHDGAEGPKAIVVKTPSPPPSLPPPGKGVVVPFVDALLDGVLIEATPRLDHDGQTADLEFRVVISHPRVIPEPHVPEPDAIQTPIVDYSRLAATTRLPVGRFSLLGTTALRRGEDDVAAVVLARVTVGGR